MLASAATTVFFYVFADFGHALGGFLGERMTAMTTVFAARGTLPLTPKQKCPTQDDQQHQDHRANDDQAFFHDWAHGSETRQRVVIHQCGEENWYHNSRPSFSTTVVVSSSLSVAVVMFKRCIR